MRDQLISLETYKLAKEKSFPFEIGFKITPNIFGKMKSSDNLYKLPTQSLLQKWLREEKEYIVLVDDMDELGRFSCSVDGKNVSHWCREYEDALEVGLYEALNKLKTKG